jgi:hypothetical protein
MGEDKTIRQLKKEAMMLKIKGYYNMTKSELAEVISRKKTDLSKKIRQLEDMEVEDLRKLSKELNLKIPWKSSRATFVKKIKETFDKFKIDGVEPENRAEESVTPHSSRVNKVEVEETIEQKVDKSKNLLPSSYFKDAFVGLDINPHWIHFYWDLSNETLDTLKSHLPVILRVYDVTYIEFNGINAHRTFEMEIDDQTRKYYVFVPQSGADYIAEIGYKEGSKFIPVLRSTLVSTPPSSPKTAQMELWMDLKVNRRFTEMATSKKVMKIERLVGSTSMPTSGSRSGSGSGAFFVLSGRRGS